MSCRDDGGGLYSLNDRLEQHDTSGLAIPGDLMTGFAGDGKHDSFLLLGASRTMFAPSSIVDGHSCCCLSTIAPRQAFSDPSPANIEYFEKKVRPLLIENCYTCHSAIRMPRVVCESIIGKD